jgi:hemolysin activation/secretion protein
VARIHPLLIMLVGLALVGIAAPRVAAAAPAREPGAIERTIPTQVSPKSRAPNVSLPVQQAAAEPSDHRKFTLGTVNIDGATVFSQEQLSRYFEPYLATEVDQAKLGEIAAAITAKYRASGYLLSYAAVPAQDVIAGMVRLQVVEGRVGKVSVQGAGAGERTIAEIAAPLTRSGPLKDDALERTLGLMRDLPGCTVTDVALLRSAVDPSLYTLKITVVRSRMHGFAFADTRGTSGGRHARLYSSLSLTSLAVQGDVLRVDLFAMPASRSRFLYGQVLAAVPLGPDGLRLSAWVSRGDESLRAGADFKAVSDNSSVQLSYPFFRSRALTVLGKASLTDWRSVGDQQGARQLRDRLRVARVGAEFSNEGVTRFQGELLLSQGIPFAGMTHAGDPLASRPGASGRFTKISAVMQLSHSVSDRFNLRLVAAAQYSSRPLLSVEEFSLGGDRIGRAYDFNGRVGDQGVGGGLELGYRPGGPAGAPEIFTYVDGGVAVDLKSPVAARQTHSLGSAGVGGRFSLGRVTFAIETGVPLQDARHPRFFASVFHAF